MLKKIISGAQRGVDRAALDIAILLNFEYGGWCPKGRLDEKGEIPKTYTKLREVVGIFKSEKENYDARTKKNIEDSDATLIIVPHIPLPREIKDGTLLTIQYAQEIAVQDAERPKEPYLILDLSQPTHVNSEKLIKWIKENRISVLNIAGPRESTCPGIYQSSFELLQVALPQCKNSFSLKARL